MDLKKLPEGSLDNKLKIEFITANLTFTGTDTFKNWSNFYCLKLKYSEVKLPWSLDLSLGNRAMHA